MPDMITEAMPKKYADGATNDDSEKNDPAISAMTGSFALHGIKVVVIIVILLSLSFSMGRAAIMPGTPHPVPISIGIKDLPESPKCRNILSRINAILDIYPHSSKTDNSKNSVIICGTKPSTAPTPAIIPSVIRLCSHEATPLSYTESKTFLNLRCCTSSVMFKISSKATASIF